jgi:hypothetical protein
MERTFKGVKFREDNEGMFFDKIAQEEHSNYWQFVKKDWRNYLKLPLTDEEEGEAQEYYASLNMRQDESQSAETDAGPDIFYDELYEQDTNGDEDEYPYIKFEKCWVYDSLSEKLRRSYNNVIVILSDDPTFPIDTTTRKYPMQVPIEMKNIVLKPVKPDEKYVGEGIRVFGTIKNINALVRARKEEIRKAMSERKRTLDEAEINKTKAPKTESPKAEEFEGGKKVKPKRSKRCKQTKKSKSKKHRRTRKATII